jgi:hypothetical protein
MGLRFSNRQLVNRSPFGLDFRGICPIFNFFSGLKVGAAPLRSKSGDILPFKNTPVVVHMQIFAILATVLRKKT